VRKKVTITDTTTLRELAQELHMSIFDVEEKLGDMGEPVISSEDMCAPAPLHDTLDAMHACMHASELGVNQRLPGYMFVQSN
jgi:hypothetical protein